MRVLITGATGFVGSEILYKLSESGFDAVGTSKSGRTDQIKIKKADITDVKSVEEAFNKEDFDAVIHCAGLAHQFGKTEKEKFDSVNILGTKNVAEAAVISNIKHFILISSTAVYGFQKKEMNEESVCQPDTDYAESKLRAEESCTEICEKNNIPLTILRLAPVLGEKGIGNVPRLIKAIYQKRFIWIGNGTNKKSLIYVGDIADACRKLLLEKKNSTEIFNLAAPPIQMHELVEIISGTLNKKVPKISIPGKIPLKTLSLFSKFIKLNFLEKVSITIEKWLSDNVYPADKIREEYGFIPKTPVKEAVRKQCLWFINQQNNI